MANAKKLTEPQIAALRAGRIFEATGEHGPTVMEQFDDADAQADLAARREAPIDDGDEGP